MADELDELYAVRPDEFTALRTELAAAAKKRGDAAATKRISGARKPTTAAWVVNLIARSERARQRLTDLRVQLRAAHAAMDGDRIRELSGEQRRLIDELTRDGFKAAGLTDPPAALRDDVVGTLQAAVADPDVADRLGRLTKAERWSGFGDFGDTAAVFTVSRKPRETPAAPPPKPADDGQLEAVRATVTAAERAKAEADSELTERQADLAAARLRRDDARRRLTEAEQHLYAAEDAYEKAKQASRDATELVKNAKAQLKQVERARRAR